MSKARKGKPAHNKGKKSSPESIAKMLATRARNKELKISLLPGATDN